MATLEEEHDMVELESPNHEHPPPLEEHSVHEETTAVEHHIHEEFDHSHEMSEAEKKWLEKMGQWEVGSA